MFVSQRNRYKRRRAIVNKTPWWQVIVLFAILVVGIIYAIPNLFGYSLAIQLSSKTPGVILSASDVEIVANSLKKSAIDYSSISLQRQHILVRLHDADSQLAAKEKLDHSLGQNYIIATLNVSSTPSWLSALNANPMKLGLDLQGGMSLLLQVDVDDVIKRQTQNSIHSIAKALRDKKIPYTTLIPSKKNITITFANDSMIKRAQMVLASRLSEYGWQKVMLTKHHKLVGHLLPQATNRIREYTMEQSITTLNRRINELGISEAQVQRQGRNRIAVSLPGVSDATKAQDILGKTATITMHLVDTHHDARQASHTGIVPAGDILLKDQQGHPLLLRANVILSGDNITSAVSNFDQTGQPEVDINVSGSAQTSLYNFTSENIGKPMAVVYTEVTSHRQSTIQRVQKIVYHKNITIINVATIESAFGASFRVTGLSSQAMAKQLALLLRAGSLPAPITILSQQQIGPSMGKKNVSRGKLSVEVGFILVVIFMACYYRLMGVIANIALVINLILIIAVMSLLQGVLTFPGIASLVLTIGMAVDANVLIFERIREELRQGVSIQTAIHAGYDRAMVTIIDAQLTTLIAAIVLFSVGSGPIKGFAIVLTIGLFTSMLTAITYTRAMVNFLFGVKAKLPLSIGIKVDNKVSR